VVDVREINMLELMKCDKG